MEYGVDIIVPAYNVKNKIDGLLCSFETQTCKAFRVILIDDGSSDGTYEYCCDISQKSSYYMTVERQTNQGPGIARQTGLRKADADYIMFCDADDYLHRSAVEHLLQVIKNEPVDILEFGYQKITADGKKLGSANLKNESIHGNCLAHYIKQKNTTNYLCNKLFRRQILRESDFKKLYYSEDARALTFIFSRCSTYRVIPNKYYFYVMNKNSACGRTCNLRRLDTVKADQEICDYVRKKDLQLLPYAACTSCVHTAKIYSGLKKAKLLGRGLEETLKAAFDRRYYELSSGKKQVYKVRSKRQVLAVELFRFSPTLFCMLA